MEKTEIRFGVLRFELVGNKITLNGFPFVEIQIAGQNKDNHLGAKHVCLSEHANLEYVSHGRVGNVLRIVQEDALVRAVSVFTSFEDTSALAVYTEVTNISAEDITIESVSSFVYPGVAGTTDELSRTYLHRFLQSHHGECRPRKSSLAELGLEKVTQAGQYRVAHANVGSWSTKEELPQGIVEHDGRFTMFQIESCHSWYYELSDEEQQIYLYLGGANEDFCGWSKTLSPGQAYRTATAVVCFAESIEKAIEDMTRYRYHIAGKTGKTSPSPSFSTNTCTCLGTAPSRSGQKGSPRMPPAQERIITSSIAAGMMKFREARCIRTLVRGVKVRRVSRTGCAGRRIISVRSV